MGRRQALLVTACNLRSDLGAKRARDADPTSGCALRFDILSANALMHELDMGGCLQEKSLPVSTGNPGHW